MPMTESVRNPVTILITHQTLAFCCNCFLGIATGSGTVCSPTYLAEISPKEKRGKIGCLNQLFSTMGIECIYILGYFLKSWVVLQLSHALGLRASN